MGGGHVGVTGRTSGAEGEAAALRPLFVVGGGSGGFGGFDVGFVGLKHTVSTRKKLRKNVCVLRRSRPSRIVS